MATGDGLTTVETVAVTTSGAYSAGDCVGGKLTLTDAGRMVGGTVLLHSLTVVDTGNVKPALELLLFGSDVTIAADNAAFTITAADLKKAVRVAVATTDYVSIDGKAIATLGNLGRVVAAVGSRALYAALWATGTPTLAADTLQLQLGFLRD